MSTNRYTAGKQADLPSVDSTRSFWHTQPSTILLGHRTTRELPRTADAVVIGSGITGASIAHHLLASDAPSGASRPRNVVMLEARDACWGATGRNGGHCQPLLFEHPGDPSIGQFEYDNYTHILQLSKHIDCEFVSQPGVRGIYGAEMLAEAKRALTAIQRTAPDLASKMHIITDREALERYRLPTASGALITNVAARLWPYKLVAGILERLLLNNSMLDTCDVRFNLQTLTPVNSIEQTDKGRWLVHTERGLIEAESVFLATNGYTSHLLPEFASLITPCRGQMSALVPPSSLSGENRLETSMGFEGRGMDDYLIQRPSASGEQLMFGGGRQLSVSLGIADDSVIDETVARYLRSTLPERFELKDVKNNELQASHEWTGIMAWSRDGLPWVGSVPDHKNLYLSAGYTGHGMPNAWLCGQALATMYGHQSHSIEKAYACAQQRTRLPNSYLITEDRIRKALTMDSVET